MNIPGNVGAPETGQPPNYQPPDVIGATNNAMAAQEAAYKQQMENQASMINALAKIGSAGITAAFPGK